MRRMTEAERIDRRFKEAGNLADQGRFAEARLLYEIIIRDLRGRGRALRKPR